MITDVKVLDNFYSDPEPIIKLVKDFPITGCGTGSRSIGLQEIDPKLYQDFCRGLFSIHGVDGRNMRVTTFFMEHTYNPIDIFNYGWVHIDGKNPDACRMLVEEYKLIFCGQIFLTPNPNPDTGVQICSLKPELNWTRQELIDKTINDYTIPKENYDAGIISVEEYANIHKEYHNSFSTTCDIKNVYNRMVSWRGGSLHGQNMKSDMPKRLNQYFFVESF